MLLVCYVPCAIGAEGGMVLGNSCVYISYTVRLRFLSFFSVFFFFQFS